MWDTVEEQLGPERPVLSHEMPCPDCGHAMHTYLPCSDTCECVPRWCSTGRAQVKTGRRHTGPDLPTATGANSDRFSAPTHA